MVKQLEQRLNKSKDVRWQKKRITGALPLDKYIIRKFMGTYFFAILIIIGIVHHF